MAQQILHSHLAVRGNQEVSGLRELRIYLRDADLQVFHGRHELRDGIVGCIFPSSISIIAATEAIGLATEYMRKSIFRQGFPCSPFLEAQRFGINSLPLRATDDHAGQVPLWTCSWNAGDASGVLRHPGPAPPPAMDAAKRRGAGKCNARRQPAAAIRLEASCLLLPFGVVIVYGSLPRSTRGTKNTKVHEEYKGRGGKKVGPVIGPYTLLIGT